MSSSCTRRVGGALVIALAVAAGATGVAHATSLAPEPARPPALIPLDDLVSWATVAREVRAFGSVRTDVGCPAGGRVFDVQIPDRGSEATVTRLKDVDTLEFENRWPRTRTVVAGAYCVAPIVLPGAHSVAAPPATKRLTLAPGANQPTPEIVGRDAADFTASACTGASDSPRCTLTLTFSPRSAGAKQASLRLRYDTLTSLVDFHRPTDMLGRYGVWRTYPWIDVPLSATAVWRGQGSSRPDQLGGSGR